MDQDLKDYFKNNKGNLIHLNNEPISVNYYEEDLSDAFSSGIKDGSTISVLQIKPNGTAQTLATGGGGLITLRAG